MLTLFLVGIGGGLGAMARYGIGSAVTQHLGGLKFPLATLLVNFIGCFLIGVLATVGERYSVLGEGAKVFWMIGFLGGFTTFSAFGFEALVLLRRDDMTLAGVYVAASLLCCLIAVWCGLRIGGIVTVD